MSVQFKLQPGQETNRETWDYFLKVLPPSWWSNDRTIYQVGEPFDHVGNLPRYDTYQKNIDGKYFYLGLMTNQAAKQHQTPSIDDRQCKICNDYLNLLDDLVCGYHSLE